LGTFSSLSTPNPSPLICFWFSIPFHSHLVISMISLPCAFGIFCVLLMHITCFQSSLHVLYVHFDVINFHYMHSLHDFTHTRCCQSLLCTLCMCLVFSILVAHSLHVFSVFDPCCMLGVVDPCCALSTCS
jgi:hypothetical protein